MKWLERIKNKLNLADSYLSESKGLLDKAQEQTTQAQNHLKKTDELLKHAAEVDASSSHIYETFKEAFGLPRERLGIALWALERLRAFLGSNDYELANIRGSAVTLSNHEIRQEIDKMIMGLKALQDRLEKGKEI